MKEQSPLSAQEKGKQNVERLKTWLKTTPKSDIPMNQFGGVAKLSVCRILNISPSTVQSNPDLAKVFGDFDNRVNGTPEPDFSPRQLAENAKELTASQPAASGYEPTVRMLESRLRRLEYLEETGVLLLK